MKFSELCEYLCFNLLYNFASQSFANCPWGNHDKSSCLNFGVDEMAANFILPLASNGITICHLNMVILVKNIDKLEELLK